MISSDPHFFQSRTGLADDLLRPMLLAKEEEEQWGFSTAEAAALAIDEVAQLRRNLAGPCAVSPLYASNEALEMN